MYENKRSEKSYVCPFSAFSCLSSFGFSVEIVISFYDLCVHIYIYRWKWCENIFGRVLLLFDWWENLREIIVNGISEISGKTNWLSYFCWLLNVVVFSIFFDLVLFQVCCVFYWWFWPVCWWSRDLFVFRNHLDEKDAKNFN